jgi:AraC-like DNA-binding protein
VGTFLDAHSTTPAAHRAGISFHSEERQDTSAEVSDSARIVAFANSAQALILEWPSLDGCGRASWLRGLVASLPPVRSIPAQIILSRIVASLSSRLDPSSSVIDRPYYDHAVLHSMLLRPLSELADTAHPQIRLAKSMVASCYGDCELNTLVVADRVGLSAVYFGRLFKMSVGQTFAAYLRQHRVAVSIDLLRDGRLTVKEIANRVGYKHLADFDRHFKLQTGKCPTMVRLRRTGAKRATVPPRSALPLRRAPRMLSGDERNRRK